MCSFFRTDVVTRCEIALESIRRLPLADAMLPVTTARGWHWPTAFCPLLLAASRSRVVRHYYRVALTMPDYVLFATTVRLALTMPDCVPSATTTRAARSRCPTAFRPLLLPRRWLRLTTSARHYYSLRAGGA